MNLNLVADTLPINRINRYRRGHFRYYCNCPTSRENVKAGGVLNCRICRFCYLFRSFKRNFCRAVKNLINYNRFSVKCTRSFYRIFCQIDINRSLRARDITRIRHIVILVNMRCLVVDNLNLTTNKSCINIFNLTFHRHTDANVRTLHHISYDMRIIFNQFFYHIFIFRSRVLFQLRFYRITIDSQFRRITYIRFQRNHHFTLIRNAFCLSIILNVDCLLLFLSNNGNRIHFTVYIGFGRYRQ